MSKQHTLRRESLERWSPTLFFAAGGAWIIDTAPYAAELIIHVSIPEALSGASLLAAFLFTLAGTLGLSSSLLEAAPTLARVGTLLVGVAWCLVLGALAWVTGAGILGLSMPPVVLLIVIISLNLLALVSIGGASVYADVPSRACGGLLIALAATWGVWIAGIVGLVNSPPEWASVVLGILFAAITLSIGAILHIGGIPLAHRESPSSPSVE